MSRGLQLVSFFVPGQPVAKQSFRVSRSGHHYQTSDVVDWQDAVGKAAKAAMVARDLHAPLAKPVEALVRLDFWVKGRQRRDIDNLCKAVLDGLKQVVFEDDDQVTQLVASKQVCSRDRDPGVFVMVEAWQ